jgi:hypothetical protein
MSQLYVFPPGFSTSVNPSVGTNNTTAPTSSTQVAGKSPGGNLVPVSVDSSGDLNVNIVNSFVPVSYNEIDLTYIMSGNGTGQIGTAVYKLSGSTVKTLTLTYNASNQLTSVVAS